MPITSGGCTKSGHPCASSNSYRMDRRLATTLYGGSRTTVCPGRRRRQDAISILTAFVCWNLEEKELAKEAVIGNETLGEEIDLLKRRLDTATASNLSIGDRRVRSCSHSQRNEIAARDTCRRFFLLLTARSEKTGDSPAKLWQDSFAGK